MEITVNHKNYFVTEHCSLQQLLSVVIQQPIKGIAIAVNETIIPKTNWETYLLNAGDQIILIKATQGG